MLCLVRLTNMALGGFVQDFASPAIQEALLKTTRKGRVVSSIGAPRANESISTSFYQQKTSTQVNPPQFLSFPLPSSKKAANSPVEGQGSQTQTSTIPSPLSKNSRQVNPKSNIPSIPSQTSLVSQPSSKESDAGVSQMTTVCVRFARSSDIDLFWIESCKTFADLSNSTNSAISYSAIYCLEVHMLITYYHIFSQIFYLFFKSCRIYFYRL